MTLKQINSLPITKASACTTSQQHTENGATTLSPSQQETAIEKMRDSSITVLSRTTMVEDGVSSLVALELDLTKDYELRGYTILGNPEPDDLHKALRKVEASLLPLPQEEIEQRLTAMSILMTIPKDFDPEVMALKRRVLAEKLTEWPADIVIDAIGFIERHNKFWPTLAEFVECMDWMMKPRKLLQQTLQKRIDNY